MSIDNKPKEEEVPKDKPESKEVANSGPITPESVVSDFLQADESPSDPNSDKANNPIENEENKGSEEVMTEVKPTEEVFAKIGNREFKTQEELTDFVTKVEGDLNSQKGFNSWLTGAVKKMRPDLFNEDGSIRSADLQKIVEGATAKSTEAAKTLNELKDIPDDDLTEEQKEDIQEAREILRPLGVVFADDPKLQKMEEDLNRYRAIDLESAQNIIEEFASQHNKCKKADGTETSFDEHRIAIGELMEQRGYDNLEKAWKVYKAEQEINEEETAPKPKDDIAKNKSVDATIPAVVKKESGQLPSSEKRDIWDDVLSIRDR